MGQLSALWKKDPGLVVSGGAHVLAFLFLILNFSWTSKLDDQVESVPVEMITTSDLNQIMNGEKTAKQMPTPQRRVDKVAELEDHKPTPPLAEAKKDVTPPDAPDKASADPGEDDKPTVAAHAPPPPPPPPPQPPVEAKPVPQPPERPVEKTEAAPAKADPVKPPPPDAEAVDVKPPPRPKDPPKKTEVKKVAKKVPKKPVPRPVEEAKVVPEPPKPPERPVEKPDLRQRTLDKVAKLLDSLKPEDKPAAKQRSGNETRDAKPSNFSFDKISALLDHETPQRKASTGKQLAHLASLGSPTAHADKMSPSMAAAIDGWLIDHYRGCWSYFGLGAAQDYVPKVHVQMTPDGSLSARPVLVNPPSDPNLRSLADSAVRAVNKCDPLPMPDWIKAHYDAWKDRTIRFDPKEMT